MSFNNPIDYNYLATLKHPFDSISLPDNYKEDYKKLSENATPEEIKERKQKKWIDIIRSYKYCMGAIDLAYLKEKWKDVELDVEQFIP